MHTLTKIFIVLQALLSVFVLALVVPLAVNQDTWKARYETEQANASTAKAMAAAQITQLEGEIERHSEEVESLDQRIVALTRDLNAKDQVIIDLRARLGTAQTEAAEVGAQLDTLTASNKTLSNIVEKMGDEITTRRNESLEIQQRAIELEDRNRELDLDLQVAVDATRIMREEVVALKEEIQQLRTGVISSDDEETTLPSPPVRGRVLQVQTDDTGRKFAVVDLGSRDGLEENMRFYISRQVEGRGRFLGFLTLTSVDINRAVGRVDLEQTQWGGVQMSDMVQGGTGAP